MNTVSKHNFEITQGARALRLFSGAERGRVIGVFSKALYCECGGEILLFHDEKWGTVPFGAAVGDVAAFLEEVAPSLDEEIMLSQSGFRIGEREYSAEIREARFKASELFAPDRDRLAALEKIICEDGSRGGIIEYCEKYASARKSITALYRALCENNGEAASDAAVRLIGLGRGLTPSGDDFLCGMFSLFFAAEKSGIAVPSAVHMSARAVGESLSRTSKISAAYLESVLSGEFFTVYASSADAALGKGDLHTLAKSVLALGASSGTDTLCGALTAAKILI